MLTRTQAEEYLKENIKNINLLKHMWCVEACMSAYAKKYIEEGKITTDNRDAEIEKWALVGLMHDGDWEAHPDEHPKKVVAWLKEQEGNVEIANAIHSHGNIGYDDKDRFIARETLMDKTLYACDEIAGFIVAVALMRPNKLDDLEASSVIKKLKDKHFAQGVNREDITQGVEELGIDQKEHIEFCINAIKGIKEKLFT